MKKINSFTKQNLQELSDEIQNELQKIADKYGLQSIKVGSGSFDATTFKCQVVVKLDPTNSPEAQEMNKNYSKMLGYSDNIVGLKFMSGGKEFEITSIEINRPKYPIVAKSAVDGKLYKFQGNKKLNFLSEVEYTHQWNIFQNAS